jgi:hypothetical protein
MQAFDHVYSRSSKSSCEVHEIREKETNNNVNLGSGMVTT